MRYLIFLICCLATPGIIRAQVPADTVLSDPVELASFTDAAALAVDPSGLVYVVDRGKNTIVRLRPDGAIESTLGGPGSETGQFDSPSDIDPTNGLVLLIADTGNSRIQRFSKDYLPLGVLYVDHRDSPGTSQQASAYNGGARQQSSDGGGRPLAVVSPSKSQLFVLEETAPAVVLWDEQGREVKRFGDYREGSGVLMEPVSLASNGRYVYVADRAVRGVLVYDLFGSYVRTLAQGLARDVRAVAVDQMHVLVILPERILVYDVTGTLVQTLNVSLPDPLVDAGLAGDRVYLLTRKKLYLAGEARDG